MVPIADRIKLSCSSEVLISLPYSQLVVHGSSALPSLADGPDDERLTATHVAAGEDTRA